MLDAARISVTVQTARQAQLLLDSLPPDLWERLQQKLRSLVTSVEKVHALPMAQVAAARAHRTCPPGQSSTGTRPCSCWQLQAGQVAVHVRLVPFHHMSPQLAGVPAATNAGAGASPDLLRGACPPRATRLCGQQEVAQSLVGFAMSQHELQRAGKALSQAAQAKADQQVQNAADTILTIMNKRCAAVPCHQDLAQAVPAAVVPAPAWRVALGRCFWLAGTHAQRVQVPRAVHGG